MTAPLAAYRRFYAEEIAAVANLRTPALAEALASVPREAFLPPGPWIVRGEFDGVGRLTPSADPRHVCHNYSIAIDPDRQLFNGAPGIVAGWIDALGLRPGCRVLHVGSGLGYYSALMSHVAGEHGRVVAVEVDAALAAAAERNLAAYAGVEVRRGDACAPFDDTFDAILVSAGVTHPQPAWLDALRVEGRLIVPLTVSMPAMGRIGKGVVVCLTRTAAEAFTARTLAMTAIYSGIGLRDDEANAELGHTFARCPMPRLTRFRRDVHTASATCWLHNSHGCFELSETG